jgi:prepilin peptidase CpaA
LLFALALLLLAASACDLQTRRIPNGLCAAGIAAGLAVHFWHGVWPGLWSLAGIAATLPLLLLYAVRAFGAGDIKLLMAVGALMGPVFLLWALGGAIFAGAGLALVWVIGKGILLRSSLPQKSRMPFAPAIVLGAVFACVHLHLGLL